MSGAEPLEFEISQRQLATIDALQHGEEPIRAPAWLARQAAIDDVAERARAAADPAAFWGEQARLVEWAEPFRQVCRFDLPHHAWFEGGRLNATVSAVDRHVQGERRNKAAIIWVGEDGEEHTYTYNRLYREMNRLANALKRLGVGRGDRVVLYMPLTPEGILAMLACARIGAIHSVVYAGMGTQALRARIVDAGARVVICSDLTWRRGKAVPLRPTVDEAVRDVPGVDHVVVHRRGSRPGGAPVSFASEREHDFYGIQLPRDIHCEPELVDAEHPLFVLYTSGTTGKPKGVVHATGGYLVGVTYLARAFYQIGERDNRYAEYWRQIPGRCCYTAGDVAVVDADGYFAVLGRADDVMNVAGHRIGTADVEGCLLRHPAVAESAVVGLPDPLKGERIKAFVVVRAGVERGPGLLASLKDHVRDDLGPIAQPSEIEILAALPKTRSGKILRRVLKAQSLGEDPGDLSTLAD